MPWSSVADVERELFPNMSHHSPAGVGLAEERGGKTRNKLILIASLLSKASNLGGTSVVIHMCIWLCASMLCVSRHVSEHVCV